MNPKALALAKAKLHKAEKAVQALKAAIDFQSAEYAWSDFVVAAGMVYAKIEQGVKKNAMAEAWFKDVKKTRESDPLLLYLYKARDADVHGVEDLTKRHHNSGRPILGRTPKFGERIGLTVIPVDGPFGRPIGPAAEAFNPGSFINLVPIRYDRNSKVCEPPRTHLGVEVKPYGWPQEVGELGLAYLSDIVSKAESFV
jgi:hypothetical protein